MSCFLFVEDEETQRKINIDELYESNQRRDLKQVSIFNKILNRIHKRITVTGRNKRTDKHIWFCVPEFIFGEPVYDNAECIAYIVAKLEDNGFRVRYVHPNTLFISWSEFVPSYIRTEFKKKTGMVINEKGQVISSKGDDNIEQQTNDISSKSVTVDKNGKKYTPIDKYKPTGNLVYDPEMFAKIEKKVEGNLPS
jgi:hypothetical protein